MNQINISIRGLLLTAIISLSAFHSSRAQAYKPYNKAQHNPFLLSVTDTIHSSYLDETRTINVYLPEGYSAESKDTYPVIYLLDGGVEEDFVHIVGLVQYNTQSWINRFPKSIVVGIQNTNRRKDFTFPVPDLNFVSRIGFSADQFPAYGGSGKFIQFLEKELQPFISATYHTNNGKTIIGESLGGLLATEILLKHRNLFDTYIIMSPSLWWGAESLLKEAPVLLQANTAATTKVYLGVCDKDENKIMYEDAVKLNEVLHKNGGTNMKVSYDYLQDEVHATIIHQAVYNAFKLLYPKQQAK